MADPEIITYSAYQSHALYPNVPAHDGGEFFSAVLWDLRNDPNMDDAKADWNIYDALYRITGDPDFSSFRSAVIAADQAAYGGANRCAIENVFAGRGIGSACVPPAAPTNLTVSGTINNQPELLWTYSPGSDSYNIYRCSSKWGTCSPFSYIGSTSSVWYIDNGKTIDDQCAYSGWINDNTFYYVTAVNYGGESDPSNTDDICTTAAKGGIASGELLPKGYRLYENYPNPFNPSTEIKFDLPDAGHVRLVVYDVVGREVGRLLDGAMEAGFQSVTWNASNLPSGVYVYRLDAGAFTQSRRMVLLK